MVYQAISIAGAFMVLGAYFALQRGWLASTHRVFNLLNFAGAGLLTWVAVVDRQLGFILVEGAWALLSLPGVFRGGPWSGRGGA